QLLAFSGGQAIVTPTCVQVGLLEPIADGLPGTAQIARQFLRLAQSLADQADRFSSKLRRVGRSTPRHVDSSSGACRPQILRRPLDRVNSTGGMRRCWARTTHTSSVVCWVCRTTTSGTCARRE